MSFNFDWSAFADNDSHLIFDRLKTVISDAFNRRRSNSNGNSNSGQGHNNNDDIKINVTSDTKESSSPRQNSRNLFSNKYNPDELGDGSLDYVEITQLSLGNRAPELVILEIDDLSNGKFRGVLQLEYEGNATIEFQTKVEANPLASLQRSSQAQHIPYSSFCTPQFLTETCSSLVVPITFRVKNIKISSLVIFVFSPGRGVTLVFRHDPSITMDIESSLDRYADPTMRSRPIFSKIINRLRERVENTMLDLFRNEIPEIVHEVSLDANVTPWGTLSTGPEQPFKTTIESLKASIKTKSEPLSTSRLSSSTPPDLEEEELDLTGAVTPSSFLDHIQSSLGQLYENQRSLSLETTTITDTVHRSNFEIYETKGQSSQNYRKKNYRRRKIKLNDINKFIDTQADSPAVLSSQATSTLITTPSLIDNAPVRNNNQTGRRSVSLSTPSSYHRNISVSGNSSPSKLWSTSGAQNVSSTGTMNPKIKNETIGKNSHTNGVSRSPPPQYKQ